MDSWRRRHRGALASVIAVVVAVSVAVVAQVLAQQPASGAARARAAACDGSHWVAAWASAPQSSSLGRADDSLNGLADGTERIFDDQTLRMIVTPHAAGSALRVHLSNRFGTAPLSVDAATVARRAAGASVAPDSVRVLTFAGNRSVVVPGADEVISDPVFVDVRPFEQLAVSFHVEGSTALDYHQWAQQTSYLTAPGSGDHAGDPRGEAFVDEVTSTYGVTAVDVLASGATGVVVTIGDSITDGIGSSPNTDQRWPDDLNRLLLASGARLSVVNAGIAGNHVVSSGAGAADAIGPAIVDRFERDALGATGVTDVVLFAGINDIFTAAPGVDVPRTVIAGYREIVRAAHASGVRVTIATITPAGLPPLKEDARREINRWIRSSSTADAVVDFDRIARDPRHPSKVRRSYDAAMAHLTDAGYRALAKAVDREHFQGTGCGA